MRKLLLLIAFLCLSYPVIAQNMMNQNDPTKAIHGSGILPKGWDLRFDHPSAKVTQIKFEKKGKSFQFTSGPAAIYYNPKDTYDNAYMVEGYFEQQKKTAHPEAYGIFVGGQNLQQDNQQYLYFLVRQDGKYLIKARNDTSTSIIKNWTPSRAVRSMNSKGVTGNYLSVVVLDDVVDFLVNGQHVITIPRSKLPYTKGIIGMRINHNLDLKVQGFHARPLHD